MKNKKILKSIIAFIFVFGLILSNLSSVFVKAAGNTDVVIHKMKLDNLTGWPKTKNNDGTFPGVAADKIYDGSQINNLTDYFGAGATELSGVTFTYWKVDNETTYKELVGAPQNFDTVEKVKAKLNSGDGNITGETTIPNGVRVTLADGYYWFIENKGSNITGNNNLEGHTLAEAAAVPFGLELPAYKADGSKFADGLNALHVYPKNTTVKPRIDKDFATELGGAANVENPREDKLIPKSIDVGTKVPYVIKTEIPAGAEYKTAYWSDKMTEGLTLNSDILVKLGDDPMTVGNDYSLDKTDKGFTLKLTDIGLTSINKQNEKKIITITYTATLNKDAVVEIPESNDVTFHYGNNPSNDLDPKPNTPENTKPKNKSISVEKKWSANGVAPQDWTVSFTLYNSQTGKPIENGATVQLTSNGPATHTWNNLDADTEYKVVEDTSINGYAPNYKVTEEGKIVVTNVKTDNPQPLKPTEPKVVTYGKKFVKTNPSNERLLGAEFYVKNDAGQYLSAKPANGADTLKEKESAYIDKIAEYNKLSAEQQKGKEGNTKKQEIENAKTERDLAFKNASENFNWVTSKDEALVLVSDEQGRFEITGLKKGSYKLEEKKAPVGYAELTTEVGFEVNATSYSTNGTIDYTPDSGLTDAQKIENKKITIPQTGGMGTVIFTVVGALIMGSAVVAMRRRKTEEE